MLERKGYTALKNVITKKSKSFGKKLLTPMRKVVENKKDVSKIAFYKKRHKREVNRKLVGI